MFVTLLRDEVERESNFVTGDYILEIIASILYPLLDIDLFPFPPTPTEFIIFEDPWIRSIVLLYKLSTLIELISILVDIFVYFIIFYICWSLNSSTLFLGCYNLIYSNFFFYVSLSGGGLKLLMFSRAYFLFLSSSLYSLSDFFLTLDIGFVSHSYVFFTYRAFLD